MSGDNRIRRDRQQGDAQSDLEVQEPHDDARIPRQQGERERDCRAGAGAGRSSRGAMAVKDYLEHRGFEDGGVFDNFAGRRGASQDENSRADDGAHAQGGQADPAKRFFQAALGLVGVGKQAVDIFNAEKIRTQDATCDPDTPGSRNDEAKLYLEQSRRATESERRGRF